LAYGSAPNGAGYKIAISKIEFRDLSGERKARIQENIYGLKEGFKEFYQSVRVFLMEDFEVLKNYPRSIGWLTTPT
jgi:hypothetical protein